MDEENRPALLAVAERPCRHRLPTLGIILGLDTVIALKRPGDYSPAEGARFEVHFEKHRNDKGDSAKTFEARLGEDPRRAALDDVRPG